MEDAKKLETAQKNALKVLNDPKSILTNVQLDRTDVVVTYAVDGALNNPRSGNAAIRYVYWQTFTATNKNTGQQVTFRRSLFPGTATFHDNELETMENLKVPAK